MEPLPFKDGSYRTPHRRISLFSRALPSISFYRQFLPIVFRSSSLAKRSKYGTPEWAESSREVLQALENAGVTVEITGIENFRTLETPCIFLSNHMSAFETFVLPCIIAPFRDVTFVVKESLIDYPVFRYVMRSRDPVTVGRTNPREDFRSVMEGGTQRLQAGRSIVIFPQTTRRPDFDPKDFNTIGIKLARNALCPVVPIALKTDAWQNGKVLKDFGRIEPSRTVHFAFGESIMVKDRGIEEQKQVIEFISTRLREWNT